MFSTELENNINNEDNINNEENVDDVGDALRSLEISRYWNESVPNAHAIFFHSSANYRNIDARILSVIMLFLWTYLQFFSSIISDI